MAASLAVTVLGSVVARLSIIMASAVNIVLHEFYETKTSSALASRQGARLEIRELPIECTDE